MATDRKPAAIVKHSLVVAGHSTSISLEATFWNALNEEAAARALSVAELVAEIDAERGPANLSSAIRVHLFRTRRPTSSSATADAPTSNKRVPGALRRRTDARRS